MELFQRRSWHKENADRRVLASVNKQAAVVRAALVQYC